MANDEPYSQIALTTADGIAHLSLARPEKLNAITVQLRGELLDALGRVAADETVKCVVLSAQGRAFCAGQDLHERAPLLAGEAIDLGTELQAGINQVVEAIVCQPQPVVCALQGAAVGAGASLALACDILVASEEATLGFGFVEMGLVPDGGASWLLARKAGPARASAILLQSERVTAAQAREYGLVWRVVGPDEIGPTVRSVATRLAASPAHSMRSAKALVRSASEQSLRAQLSLEAEAQSRAGRSRAYLETLRKFLLPK